MAKLVIGPATGWMYANGVNAMSVRTSVLFNALASAAELSLGDSLDPNDDRVWHLLNNDKEGDFSGCNWLVYRSLHLPNYNPNESRVAQAKTAAEIVRRHLLNVAVIHPLRCEIEGGRGYPLDYYDELKDEGIILAIENMDAAKPSGFRLEELARLVDFADLGFVFDLQHAYEHDPQMVYAWDLFQALKSHIVHLHVSGQSAGNNHSLVCRAENAPAIMDFLGRVLSEIGVPIILEGEYRTAEDLVEEIAFIEKGLFS